MTTEPLKEPLNQRGTLYQADRFLANRSPRVGTRCKRRGVKCLLTPADLPVRARLQRLAGLPPVLQGGEPVQGIAEVPDGVDWLNLGTLTLALRNGRRYRITPPSWRARTAPQRC